jgi:ABC-type sugar transport system ATPase subunit
VEAPNSLNVRGLTKAYSGRMVVDGVDLTVGASEIVALVGKNGAGKSTVIRIVTGATSSDEGTVAIDGEIRHFTGPAAARRAGVSAMHQELNVASRMTVAENLGLGAGYPRRAGVLVDWGALDVKARALLDRVDLAGIDPRTPVGALSPVQQRLVMIAAALWHEARILILDEPTAALTEEEIVNLHKTVRSLSADGVGILYVSHRLNEVMSLAHRIVVMRDGRVVADVPAGAVTKSELVGMISGLAQNVERLVAPKPLPEDAPVALDVRDLRVKGSGAPVSLKVRAGEILGVGGLVGSGRTELLRGIYGADHGDGGAVVVDGRHVRRGSPRASIASGIVLLTEDRAGQGLFPSFSVRWNTTIASLNQVRFLRWLPVTSSPDETRSAHVLLQRLQVAAAGPGAQIDTLSGGNQQKVLVARWLATHASVLLLDEPTIGIDAHAKEEIYKLLHELAEQGLAIVVVSADLSELELLCHRVLVLHGGAVVQELQGSAVTEDAILRACFHVDDAAVAQPSGSTG